MRAKTFFAPGLLAPPGCPAWRFGAEFIRETVMEAIYPSGRKRNEATSSSIGGVSNGDGLGADRGSPIGLAGPIGPGLSIHPDNR